ncbi:FimV/HubP family polar landmark protein [Sterolibacterium denitrificans]|nr:FimV/HubP family polar landmark protein [Sterolibacterium denitrificans]
MKFQASAIALALAALPLGAEAAGLGNIKVLSVLGQPLLAEIDITASREEAPTLAARLAPYEAFQQAGIEYNPAISDLKVSIEKRADNRLYLQLRTDQALNEPFLDLLLEMSWAAGRLQREYLFLLDPPDALQKPAPQDAPDRLPVVRAGTAAPAAASSSSIDAKADATQPAADRKTATTEKPASTAAPNDKPAAVPAPQATQPTPDITAAAHTARTARTVAVKSGDTLSKIASEALQTLPVGVNLDQMLIALFRSNRDAFIGGNINRLRAGKILAIPDQDSIAAVDPREARELVIAQSADFNAYRKRLAATTEAAPAAQEAAPQQLATGRIEAKVEEKRPPPAASEDRLEISKSAAASAKEAGAGKSPAARTAAIEEDLVAREKTLQEANSRIAELDRNLADMRKALELKSQTLAAAQNQAAAPASTPEPAAAPAPTPKAAETTAQAGQSPAPKKPAKKKAAPAPKDAAQETEPSFIADNPELVYGGSALIALLLGYLGFSQWRKKRAAQPEAAPEDRSDPKNVEDPSINSVFGNNGGQVVDTGSTAAGSSLDTDFSVVSSGGADTNESVDPIAEADVYMAYGRNAQAEEILLDAMKKDPARHAIPLKLLEIYAARKSLKQFEAIASDLHGQTGGTGESWEQAARLGRSIDPENPLYGQANAVAAAAAAATQQPQDAGQALYDPTATMVLTPQDFDKIAAEFDAPAAPAAPLDMGAVTPDAADAGAEAEEVPESLDFELDLGSEDGHDATNASPSLDFDLGLNEPKPEPAPAADAAPAASTSSTTGGDEVDFEEAPAIDALPSIPAAVDAADAAPSSPASAAASGIDLASISLELDAHDDTDSASASAAAFATESSAGPADLDIPPLSAAAEGLAAPLSAPASPPAAPSDLADEAGSPEVDTKLELAAAYEEMGDKEGARELLQEVLNEGNAAQQAAARDRLAQLG